MLLWCWRWGRLARNLCVVVMLGSTEIKHHLQQRVWPTASFNRRPGGASPSGEHWTGVAMCSWAVQTPTSPIIQILILLYIEREKREYDVKFTYLQYSRNWLMTGCYSFKCQSQKVMEEYMNKHVPVCMSGWNYSQVIITKRKCCL